MHLVYTESTSRLCDIGLIITDSVHYSDLDLRKLYHRYGALFIHKYSKQQKYIFDYVSI